MKRKFLLLFLALPPLALAQATYKCTVNGKSSYSDRPCGENAKTLAVGESAEEKQRLRDAARQRREASAAMTEAAEQVRREGRERAAAQRSASRPTASAERDSQQSYCDGLLRKAKAAKDEAEMYRYHQGLIDDAKRRQKEAEDEHFSRCYGSVSVR